MTRCAQAEGPGRKSSSDVCRAAWITGSETAFHYPQKLWITLWTAWSGEGRNPGYIAYLLPW